jgi:hypothetical protein
VPQVDIPTLVRCLVLPSLIWMEKRDVVCWNTGLLDVELVVGEGTVCSKPLYISTVQGRLGELNRLYALQSSLPGYLGC